MGPGSGLACDLTLNSTLTPALQAKYQNTEVIREVLGQSRTIAMVGLSSNPQKASQFVATYLRYQGYKIVPVNPRESTIMGETCYPDLQSIPFDIDIVDVFRPSAACPDIARAAVEAGARVLWLQLSISSLEAAEIAEKGGVRVVMDRCLKMEHGRYDGSMHWVGMNTGIITAKKGRRWF